jgi:hypothetical protein
MEGSCWDGIRLKLLDEKANGSQHRAKLSMFSCHFANGMAALVHGKNILVKVMDKFIRSWGQTETKLQ